MIINSGPFVFSFSSPHRVPYLAKLYKQCLIEKSDDYKGIIDFYVDVQPVSGIRHWLRPQVKFQLDKFEPFKPMPASHVGPILEWGMNWCVSSHIHECLNIHAAVVEKNGKAIILPGDPGSGKSTLTALLVHNGWRLLSDEMTLYSLTEHQVIPAVRPISLKNQSIELIRKLYPTTYLSPASLDTIKGTVAHMAIPDDAIAGMYQPATPVAIVYPKYKQGVDTQVCEVGEGQTFMHIIRNAFNYDVLGEVGFARAAALTKSTQGYYCEYSQFTDIAEFFDELVCDE
ncbi:HprK-related kinase A [Flocculibacter collagenilyticus]|uniref:HprK-related kinase A n=1 Tax=Flocculibacter collagenilyticus TaxID=2744479 RepID=UPI0018F52D0C|nr:HprK-related kinase A [Flocculibacter collagenilyticus]